MATELGPWNTSHSMLSCHLLQHGHRTGPVEYFSVNVIVSLATTWAPNWARGILLIQCYRVICYNMGTELGLWNTSHSMLSCHLLQHGHRTGPVEYFSFNVNLLQHGHRTGPVEYFSFNVNLLQHGHRTGPVEYFSFNVNLLQHGHRTGPVEYFSFNVIVSLATTWAPNWARGILLIQCNRVTCYNMGTELGPRNTSHSMLSCHLLQHGHRTGPVEYFSFNVIVSLATTWAPNWARGILLIQCYRVTCYNMGTELGPWNTSHSMLSCHLLQHGHRTGPVEYFSFNVIVSLFVSLFPGCNVQSPYVILR